MLKRYILDLGLNPDEIPLFLDLNIPPKKETQSPTAAPVATGPEVEPLPPLWPLARAYLGTCGAGNVTMLLLLAPRMPAQIG
jgi:hypothetical protein